MTYPRCSCEALVCPAGKCLCCVPIFTAPGELEPIIPCSQGSSLVILGWGSWGVVLSKSSQWPFQPGGPKAALVSGMKVLVNLDTWCTAPQVFPGPVMPSLWAARGRYRPSSPAPASPWHGFGIGHLCGSHFPVPEPQPGLVEADQSIPLRCSK